MTAEPTEVTRYGATRADVERLLDGEPRYRVDQVWDALWTQRRALSDTTNVPRALRAGLERALPLALEERIRQDSADGLTTKWLWVARGAQIETVLMRSAKRATVCVSSQAGCAMACTFCATGQAGFERHLDAGEIVEQVMRAQHASPQRVSNVVFMGMGEPLANLDEVWQAVVRLHDEASLSARHITISTVGIVPGMRRLTELPLPVTLAVSLHAPDDELRNELVPVNRRYPVVEVVDAARAYADRKGRRVTFEYAMIDHVNDDLDRADRLAALLARFPGGAHVNLIPLNPTAGYAGRVPQHRRIDVFARRLRANGVNATVRRNRGVDIDAACGQLRARRPVAPEPATMDS